MSRRISLSAVAVLLMLVGGLLAPTSAAPVRPVTSQPSGHHRAIRPSFGAALLGRAPTGTGPAATAYDASTDTIYVANGFNPNGPNLGGHTVSVIDGRRCDGRSVAGCRGPWATIAVGPL